MININKYNLAQNKQESRKWYIAYRGELGNTTCHPTTHTRMEKNSKIDQSQ